MQENTLIENFMIWGSLIIYVTVTIALTIRGMKQTKDLNSFAVGNRNISPAFVGLSLTAQLTSVATFVVNPGLVYSYGLSALMGLGAAAGLGIITGLSILSGPFRRVGAKVKALTIPQWIGKRYDSTFLRLFFAVLSLCLMSFIVLIAVALAFTIFSLLSLENLGATTWIVSGIMAFVFTYTLLGGASTSTYTNAIQAMIMVLVGLILVGSGIPLFFAEEGIFEVLSKSGEHMSSVTNPDSLYFRNFFEVFICNFVVGLAIVCQPHILGKAFLLSDDSQIKKYLAIAFLAGAVFVGVMVTGLYARATLPEISNPDHAVPTYIATFSTPVRILISIGLLCAGISTLEGLLLALSAIFSSDIYMTLKASSNPEEQEKNLKKALTFGRVALVIAGIICVYLSVQQIHNPTGGSVAIFAQYGVYLLFTATFLPIACGLFIDRVGRELITYAVLTATAFYFLPIVFMRYTPELPFVYMANNPAFLAFCGITAGWLTIGLGLLSGQKNK